MTAKRYERNGLRQMLSLTCDQMKYVATIAGNDYSGHMTKKRCDFIKVSDFCRSIDSKQSKQLIYQEIEKYIRNDDMYRRIDVSSIRKSIDSYDTNIEIGKPFSEFDVYCSANVLMFAFYNQKVFQYETNFLDFKQRNKNNANNNNNDQLFLDTMLEVFCKLAGILLNEIVQRNPLVKIVTKYSLYERYTLKEHAPIYPQGKNNVLGYVIYVYNICVVFNSQITGKINIEDLIFGNNIDTKWDLLLWSIGINAQLRSDLECIPNRYVHAVLALTFLRKVS